MTRKIESVCECECLILKFTDYFRVSNEAGIGRTLFCKHLLIKSRNIWTCQFWSAYSVIHNRDICKYYSYFHLLLLIRHPEKIKRIHQSTHMSQIYELAVSPNIDQPLFLSKSIFLCIFPRFTIDKPPICFIVCLKVHARNLIHAW